MNEELDKETINKLLSIKSYTEYKTKKQKNTDKKRKIKRFIRWLFKTVDKNYAPKGYEAVKSYDFHECYNCDFIRSGCSNIPCEHFRRPDLCNVVFKEIK